MKTLVLLALLTCPAIAQNDTTKKVDSVRVDMTDRMMSMTLYTSKPQGAEERLSPFIAAGFEGMPHREASMYAGFGAEYTNGRFGLMMLARYQYDPLFTTDSVTQSGSRLAFQPIWHTVFEGDVRLYLW